MKKIKNILIMVFLALSIFGVTSCTKSKISNTLLIYMCGSTLESKNGNGTKNISEMLSYKIPSNTRVIIETGGSESWKKYNISNEVLSRYELIGKKIKLIETTELKSMGLSNTLKEFIEFGVKYSETDNISLLFWNHGGGSISGVCSDSLFNNDCLTLQEIDTALDSIDLDKKFNFIGFDACLMATYSMADILKDHADYMIASQELEPSSGWNYASLLEAISKNNLKKILEGYASKQSEREYYTLSLIDLSKFYIFSNTLELIVHSLENNTKNKMANILNEVTQYGSGTYNNGQSNLFDLGQIAQKLNIDTDFNDFIDITSGKLRKQSTGLSLYFPLNKKSNLDTFLNINQSIDYKNYLDNYFNGGSSNVILFEDNGFENNNKLSFIIDESSIPSISSVKYELFQNIPDEDFELVNGLGIDDDIIVDGNQFTINFNGNWLYFNDEIINCEILEEHNLYTLFSGNVLVNNQRASLIINYNKQERTANLEGYVTIEDETHYSRLEQLDTGDIITVLYNDKTSDIYNVTFEEGNKFIYSNDIEIKIKVLPDGYYTYRGVVEDIYGNIFYSATAVVYIKNGQTSVYIISK